MNNKLQLILDEQNVAKENADKLIEAFGAPFLEAGEILRTYETIVVTNESQVDLMKEAKQKRITLKNIRTGVEKKRKELKEDSLRTGRAIDSVAKYVKENIEPAEKYLELQERFAEIKKAERDAKIKSDRIEKLMQFTDNISMYNIDHIEDETFETLLSKVKKEYDDKIAAEKAESDRIEKERLAKEADDKRIREENEKLRQEAEKREAEIELQRKAEAEAEAKREAERQKETARLAKIESDHQAELEVERAKSKAIEDERLAKELTERQAKEKAEAEAKQAEMNALLAPDKDKLLNFSNALETIRTTKLPAVKTKQAQDVVNLIDEMFIKMKNIIDTKAKEL